MDAARLASDVVVILDEVLAAVLYPALLQTGGFRLRALMEFAKNVLIS